LPLCRRYGRTEPAPPRGGRSQVRWPSGERPGDNVEAAFLGGARSPRPRCKAVRTPRHFISTTCVDDEPVAKRRQRCRCAVVTGVRSPPLQGGQAWARGLAGKPGDGAKGGFLGGAHSVRPHGKAKRAPRHFITRGGWPWPNRDMPRSSRCLPPGVQSPPLREMVKRCEESLTGANRGTAPKPLFSEGRTLRARMARLNERQGIPFPPDACARRRDPKGENPPRSQCRRYGRAEPAPPRGGLCKLGWPCGEDLETMRRVNFSEGRGLRVRVVRPHECRGVPF